MEESEETCTDSSGMELRPWKTDPDVIRGWPVARTNVQLYNQLIDQGRPLNELILVRDAYRLAMQHYAGKYGSDCASFITHPVGVASIMTGLGYTTDYVVISVVHNIYVNADWGDGRGPGNWPSRRARVIECLGAGTEELLSRFLKLRVKRTSFPALLDEVDRMDAVDHALMTIEVADFWDKYCELAVSYYGVERWDISLAEKHRDDLVELARRLGHSALGDMLDQAIRTASDRQVPKELCGDTRWSKISMAPSLMMRPKVRLLMLLRPAIRKTRAYLRKLTR